jgi:hypothetical protein
MKKTPDWFDIYPQGTEEGDKEQKFFISLSRDPEITWKNVRTISRETDLDMEDVEKIIEKYLKLGLVVNNPNYESEWGYFKRVIGIPKPKKSITEENQNKRIKED